MLRAWLDKIAPPGPAETYRRAARTRLRQEGLRHPSPDVVELGALALFERELASRPRHQLTQRGAPRLDPALAAYTSHLTATLGVSGPLAPALAATLRDFRPELLWRHGAQSRLLGSIDQFHQSQLVLGSENQSFSLAGRAVRVTGVTRPDELGHLRAAAEKLQRRLPAAAALLETIHLRPFLGYAPGVQVSGLAGTRPGQVALENLVARDSQKAEDTLYHELGHLLDRQKELSSRPGSPFLDPGATVSSYARTSPAEDLAETHKVLLQSLDMIRSCPDLVHACGLVGEKLAFLLDRGYQQPLPPPTALLAELQQGPFGWETPQGKLGAAADLAHCALELLRHGAPQDERQEWLLARLSGQTPPPVERPSLRSLHHQLKQAAEARQAVRQGEPGRRSELMALRRNLAAQLESGGPPLQAALKGWLEQNEPRHSGVWQQYGLITRRTGAL